MCAGVQIQRANLQVYGQQILQFVEKLVSVMKFIMLEGFCLCISEHSFGIRNESDS